MFRPHGQRPVLKEPSELGPNDLWLYDIWVSHDATGARMGSGLPYVSDEYSQARLARGLPVPVHCCWNGLVVMAAEPFRRGLRMRRNVPGECAASECELLCEDFERLGYTRAVLDPGVRQAYDFPTARKVSHGTSLDSQACSSDSMYVQSPFYDNNK
jgi:alpha-1,3-mannosyltransferase